jgi:hypothetical protein
MPTPGSYYDALPARLVDTGIGALDESIDVLRELQILVDGSARHAYLLQIFLKEAAACTTIRRRGRSSSRSSSARGRGLRRRQLPRAVRGDRAGTGGGAMIDRIGGRRAARAAAHRAARGGDGSCATRSA